MNARWMIALVSICAGFGQSQPGPEQQQLIQALTDANNSSVDIIRVLEAFLKAHPETAQRKEIERTLAKAAIDVKDDRRTVLYGERVLAWSDPPDIPVLDRVAYSLLALGGPENAQKALQYAHSFELLITGMAPPDGADSARRQEERDRALSRTFLYQARAKTTLGDPHETERLCARAFSVYPTEEAAREWSGALARTGQEEAAVAKMADAFVIPDPHVVEADRAGDRRRVGELYRKLHGSEEGLGDVVLAAHDRIAKLLEERRNRLITLEPNFGATEPMQFVLSGLDGKKLPLASLKGKVVVLDFWATWCAPCRTQHPMYETVKQHFKDRSDVVFLAIDADEERPLVGPFLDEQKWSRAVYFEDGLQRFLQVAQIPTTLLLDKRGRVWSRMNGFLPDRFVEQLTERINGALAE